MLSFYIKHSTRSLCSSLSLRLPRSVSLSLLTQFTTWNYTIIKFPNNLYLHSRIACRANGIKYSSLSSSSPFFPAIFISENLNNFLHEIFLLFHFIFSLPRQLFLFLRCSTKWVLSRNEQHKLISVLFSSFSHGIVYTVYYWIVS